MRKLPVTLLSLILGWWFEKCTCAHTHIYYPTKGLHEFNVCFQQILQKLKDMDSTMAMFLNPQVDSKVLASALPFKINLTQIPTEMEKMVMVTLKPHEESHAHFTHDILKKVNFPANVLETLSMSKLALKEQIRYLLFTKDRPKEYEVMPRDGRMVGTKWRPNRKVKVLVHGLTSTVWLPPLVNIWSQHIFELKDAFVEKSADPSLYNVIVVDWTSLSTVPLYRYPDAAFATKEAGKDLAEFLVKLRNSNHIQNWDDVQIVGHSLGAHVAGVAGSELRKQGAEYTLGRITGLDPAGLCFDSTTGSVEDLEVILDWSDAKFVDIMHTNMGNILESFTGKYGSLMQTGHADFYPNGGESQHGCSTMEDRLFFCSHQKSVLLYAKSIWDKAVGCPSSSWDNFRANSYTCTTQTGGHYMGEYCDNTAHGKYFLDVSTI